MTAICVDDEPLVLQMTAAMCRGAPGLDQVESFAGAREALEWLEDHKPDLALLDINMPDMNGIMLAIRIKEHYPDTAIIFLTGYSEYAVEAFRVRASGYLLKPFNREQLYREIEYALEGKPVQHHAHVTVQTFGNFDVFVDGKLLSFARAKSKELLAYLVDRQGSSVSRAEASSVLWEGSEYDRTMQKQLDVMIRSLRKTLEEHGIGDIIEMNRNDSSLRVVAEHFDCDLYRLFAGDAEAANHYRGEYMSAYSWASLTEAYLERKLDWPRQQNRK